MIGGLAGAGGMLAGTSLAPKPTAASQSTATGTPALPPTTASTASGNTMAAGVAALRQKRRARGTPPLTAPQSLLGGTSATTQPQTLLGY